MAMRAHGGCGPAAALDDGGDGDQGEGVGGAVADLAIELPARRRRRQDHGGDHLAGFQAVLDMRRGARQAMQLGERRGCGSRRRALIVSIRCIERDERHRHVGRMDRDAGLAGPEDRVHPVEPADRGTARSGRALLHGMPRS